MTKKIDEDYEFQSKKQRNSCLIILYRTTQLMGSRGLKEYSFALASMTTEEYIGDISLCFYDADDKSLKSIKI